MYPDGGYTEFSADGPPTAMRDRHRLSDATGSELRFIWYGDGTLAQIAQVNGTFSQVQNPRTLTFSYKEDSVHGVISSVEDSTGRIYDYDYDAFGRLEEARIEEIQLSPRKRMGQRGRALHQPTGKPRNATPRASRVDRCSTK